MSIAEEALIEQRDLVRFGLALYAELEDVRQDTLEIGDDDVAEAISAGAATYEALDNALELLLQNPSATNAFFNIRLDAKANAADTDPVVQAVQLGRLSELTQAQKIIRQTELWSNPLYFQGSGQASTAARNTNADEGIDYVDPITGVVTPAAQLRNIDDSVAVQAAFDYAQDNGLQVYLPKGIWYVPQGVTLAKDPAKSATNLSGPGTLMGGRYQTAPVLTVGSKTTHASRTGMLISEITLTGPDTTDPYTSTLTLIAFGKVSGITLLGVDMRRARTGHMVIAENGFHHSAVTHFSDCRFSVLFFGIYVPETYVDGVGATVTRQWDLLSDWNISSCVFRTIYGVSIALDPGTDGASITSNRFFASPSGSRTTAYPNGTPTTPGDPGLPNTTWFAQKGECVRIGRSDWVGIHNNDFFESGRDGLRMYRPARVSVTGNRFARIGQTAPFDCIAFVGVSTTAPIATISGNVFANYSHAAVGFYQCILTSVVMLANTATFLSATGSVAAGTMGNRDPDVYYWGPGALTTGNVFRYFADTLCTGRLNTPSWTPGLGLQDSIRGASIRANTREQQGTYMGRSSAEFSVAVNAGGTRLISLTDFTDTGDPRRAFGTLEIFVRSAGGAYAAYWFRYGFGTLRSVDEIGDTTNAAATNPAIDFSIELVSGSPSRFIQAKPRAGITAGQTFNFSIQGSLTLAIGVDA